MEENPQASETLQQGKDISRPKYDNHETYFKCGYCNHVAKKYKIPMYLVQLYMMSMRCGQNAEGRKYGLYFISNLHEIGTSDSVPDGARPSEPRLATGGESFRT